MLRIQDSQEIPQLELRNLELEQLNSVGAISRKLLFMFLTLNSVNNIEF